MDKEINLHRLRLVIRGALDYLNRDGGDINEALTAQGKVKLTVTMESIETALLWLRRMGLFWFSVRKQSAGGCPCAPPVLSESFH